eukprot:TRINITY_DN14226_c0_g1_i1.p1 TRINITY_DN14226_c0_g1~~TRINITY_DN14226_c0_g1_i1.p1  ORF type:complete len:182 (+),score=15.49 TRINITY_DN14226_c0_g1_i1:106-651(+)
MSDSGNGSSEICLLISTSGCVDTVTIPAPASTPSQPMPPGITEIAAVQLFVKHVVYGKVMQHALRNVGGRHSGHLVWSNRRQVVVLAQCVASSVASRPKQEPLRGTDEHFWGGENDDTIRGEESFDRPLEPPEDPDGTPVAAHEEIDADIEKIMAAAVSRRFMLEEIERAAQEGRASITSS